MTWFKVDDSFHSHPKVLASRPAALGLWVVAGSWSSANLTGGFVSDQVVSRLVPGAAKLARELVTVGLWTRTKGGYQFHDWSDYQPTKEEATTAREKKSTGGQLGNHRRWHLDRGVTDPGCPFCRGSHDRSDSDPAKRRPTARQPHDPKPNRKSDESLRAHRRDHLACDVVDPECPHCQAKHGSGVSDIRSDSDRSGESDPESPPNPPVPSPSRPEGTRTGTGSQSSSRRNARETDDDDPRLDQKITDLLRDLTGRTVPPDWAARVRRQLLGGRDVERPVAYITRAIRERPGDFLPPSTPPAKPVPPLPPLGERDNTATNSRGRALVEQALGRRAPDPGGEA